MTVRQMVILGPTDPAPAVETVKALATLASSEGPVVLLDADVLHSRLANALGATEREPRPFSGSKIAIIVQERCTGCGACLQYCRLRAISVTPSGYWVDPSKCEGCHSCHYQCPSRAIDMLELETGVWFVSPCAQGVLYHGRVQSDRPRAGGLVNALRLEARTAATAGGQVTLLVAVPYDIPDVVEEACVGADLVLLAVATEQDLAQAERVSNDTLATRVPRMALVHHSITSAASFQPISTQLASAGISIVLNEPLTPTSGGRTGDAGIGDYSSLAGLWQRILHQLRHR